MYEGSHFSTSCQHFVVHLLDYSYPSESCGSIPSSQKKEKALPSQWGEVTPHRGFDLHFLED